MYLTRLPFHPNDLNFNANKGSSEIKRKLKRIDKPISRNGLNNCVIIA
jgi:hypothetical protein